MLPLFSGHPPSTVEGAAAKDLRKWRPPYRVVETIHHPRYLGLKQYGSVTYFVQESLSLSAVTFLEPQGVEYFSDHSGCCPSTVWN